MDEEGRKRRVLTFVVTLLAVIAFAPAVGFMANASADTQPTYQVSLWDTKDFNSHGMWGTEFFYQATNEYNPSYDWYFVSLKFHRASGGGDLYNWWAYMYIWDNNGGQVVTVDYEPTYHAPWNGDTDIGVSGGGGSVTMHLEGSGYDYGGQSNPYSWETQFKWQHDFTQADAWFWSTKSGGYVSKVTESNGNTNSIYGSSSILNHWAAWDWGCWCNKHRYDWASFPNGAGTHFGDATPGQ